MIDGTLHQKVVDGILSLLDCEADDLHDDSNLAELGLDSLQAVQLLVLLERTLKVKLGEQDLQRFNSVGNILSVLESRMGAQA
jgi:acyl carrier protein